MRTYLGSSIFSRAISGVRGRLAFVAMFVLATVGSASFASLLYSDSAVAADKKPQRISAKVGKELKDVNEALAAQDFAKVLALLDKADAVDKKTPYDQFKIDELRAHVYLSQKKYAEVLPIYEKFLESRTEFMEPEAIEILPKQLTQLAFQLQQHDKVQQFAQRWLTSHPEDTQIMDLLGRSRYMIKDYQGALQQFQSAIGTAEKAAKAPEEIWMQLVVSSVANLDDDEKQIMDAYRKLARYHPKTEHWGKLLDRALYSEKNDLGMLYTFRLMSETGVLARPEQYLEYAQFASEKAFPGEAYAALQSGFDKGILGKNGDTARQQRTLTEMKQKAETDRKQLPQFEKEAKGPKATGQMVAGLGYAHYSFGQYPEAIESINAGLEKGGVRNTDDARMLLGISYLRAGQKEQARQQFESVAANSPLANAAQLWAIRTHN